ncbi:AP2 domain-containing protein [Oscillatoria laete-virens NRMC-F 0139]|nr:AP2 domain-containing protein [Oscillatoria laete-virens]MDL5055066.1 AP2 domain-containing protein [Oscillatoria laete-virens NRMC-F 0139]
MVKPLHIEFKRTEKMKLISAHRGGFVVRIQRRGVRYQMNFSFRNYGGEALALKEAIVWRNDILSHAGPPQPHPYCMSHNKRNKTGKVGVSFIRRGADITAVVARWREAQGKFMSKSFSVAKLGLEQALAAAKALREIKEMELQCFQQIDDLTMQQQTQSRRFIC